MGSTSTKKRGRTSVRTPARAHMHTRTHAHMHTHTHTCTCTDADMHAAPNGTQWNTYALTRQSSQTYAILERTHATIRERVRAIPSSMNESASAHTYIISPSVSQSDQIRCGG
eukprot:GHVU01110317.1.p2 GENE.GHVU01110317.1~~GHVU01110317.1.p2  ORF type:complete len:113 (-),score=3.07 GHVU01110317.1:145-483(-)